MEPGAAVIEYENEKGETGRADMGEVLGVRPGHRQGDGVGEDDAEGQGSSGAGRERLRPRGEWDAMIF